MSDLRIAVILGTTRPGRRGEAVAQWIVERGNARDTARYELVDLADYPLPHLDEVNSAKMGQYEGEHTKTWSAVIDQYDGFVFVTPEYNASISGVLKNAIDYLYAEWTNKAAAFASYGVNGGMRAVQQLRTIASELELAGVRQSLNLSVFADWQEFTTFAPGAHNDPTLETMFGQLESWAGALQPLRAGVAA
ncbi:MAG: NAD(P)H-dependent oxidoreductase [Microbacteriaceae bacterium]|nr:NAD(P)H-dependent oxidoreductase [Microbacteriaceae bacterium]